jgi:hypothetical protein
LSHASKSLEKYRILRPRRKYLGPRFWYRRLASVPRGIPYILDISFGVPAFWIMGKAVARSLFALMVSLFYPPHRCMVSVAFAPWRKVPTPLRGTLSVTPALPAGGTLLSRAPHARPQRPTVLSVFFPSRYLPQQGRTSGIAFSCIFGHQRRPPPVGKSLASAFMV